MICFSRFVVLDFQFLSWKPLNSRRKDDIVIANVVSTLNWITPVQWMETLVAQYHGQTILSVFVRKTFTVWVGTISFAACHHASSFTFQNKISLFAVRVEKQWLEPLLSQQITIVILQYLLPLSFPEDPDLHSSLLYLKCYKYNGKEYENVSYLTWMNQSTQYSNLHTQKRKKKLLTNRDVIIGIDTRKMNSTYEQAPYSFSSVLDIFSFDDCLHAYFFNTMCPVTWHQLWRFYLCCPS